MKNHQIERKSSTLTAKSQHDRRRRKAKLRSAAKAVRIRPLGGQRDAALYRGGRQTKGRAGGFCREVKVVTVREESASLLHKLKFDCARMIFRLWTEVIARGKSFQEDKEHCFCFSLDTKFKLKTFASSVLALSMKRSYIRAKFFAPQSQIALTA